MRVPLEWLREWVEFEDSPEGLAERLTFGGIEVEAIERVGSTYEGVVVGEVRAVERHPNADRLTVCRVWDGQQEVTVVCGAPNVRAGGRYPLARPGARLPNGMEIRAARIRGVESSGMLCAPDELGISDDHSGLLELPADARPGSTLAEVLGGPDVVLDLEITPNRPDCLSVVGIAREVAALYRTRVRVPEFALSEATDLAPVTSRIHVEVEDSTLCPRYTARCIEGVRIGLSPAWMRWRLERAGVRPICNAVDVTNYVMLELGQPQHAFDLALIRGGVICVRRARPGERIRTLDGEERELSPEMLVIADAEGPVAIAGVMGGEGSGVTERTTAILLESASFLSSSVRVTSRRLGLNSESSFRFARGVDPELAELASRRAAALLAQLTGGRVVPGVVDVYPRPERPRTVSVRMERVRSLLGVDVSTDQVADTLSALGWQVRREADDRLTAVVPTWRRDVTADVDVIEEFARVYGLDRIPAPAPAARVVLSADDREARADSFVRQLCAALGLQEVMNYSLTSDRLLDQFGLDDPALRIRLPNPISAEQAVLRTDLIPQLVETLGRNRARQVEHAAVVEFGRVFRRGPEGGSIEIERLAIGLMGSAGRGPLSVRPTPKPLESFLWVKGIVERLCEALRTPVPEFQPVVVPAFEPGESVQVVLEGQPIGRAGVVRKVIASEWRIYDPVAVAELDIEPFLRHWGRVPTPVPPPVFPCAVRDLAFVVDRRIRNEQILAAIRQVAPPFLESVTLFDVYEGPGIPEGRKSMAYSLTYRSPERTITDEEVQRAQERIAAHVAAELGATLRAG